MMVHPVKPRLATMFILWNHHRNRYLKRFLVFTTEELVLNFWLWILLVGGHYQKEPRSLFIPTVNML
jgi:hypothetical protein